MNGKYEPVIGLEVHAQMLTASKAFCGCSTKFGKEPNTNVCPVCLGMPGTLPVLNRDVVEFVLRMGIAVGCTIAPRSVFARKNYFYPDLPKGYQISQYEEPICTGGLVTIDLEDGSTREIGLTRIHMEEDAGKSIHDVGAETLVDVNRCGVPLIEIVSEPEIRSPGEAHAYLTRIRQLVTYLGICDGNMEEGSLRCDANVSVRLKGERAYGTKTEVKNMNSFRNVERALAYEINRQIGLLEDGGHVVQETMLWDADRNLAAPMRSKEEAHDYRYFPDPDLVPVSVNEAWIARVRASLPELPAVRRDRFIAGLGLPRYDADLLTGERPVADYFEAVLEQLNSLGLKDPKENAKSASNWVMTEVLRALGERKETVAAFPIAPARLGILIGMVQEGTLSGTAARQLFAKMLTDPGDPHALVRQQGLAQVSDRDAIAQVIDEVLNANPQQVAKYLGGGEKVFGYFVGESMRRMGGKGNPNMINEILRAKLNQRRT
ncbi:MAG TPA: Asp-tRNA(Asn)/Glu-tRNA(Gln) amidotransferase subunit GatB [Bacteroidota bacterium]